MVTDLIDNSIEQINLNKISSIEKVHNASKEIIIFSEKTNNKSALAADKLKLRRTTLIEKMKKYLISSNCLISLIFCLKMDASSFLFLTFNNPSIYDPN